MDLTLTIDSPEALTARGVSNTQDWIRDARTHTITIPAAPTVRTFDVPGPDGKPRPLIPGLSLRPYTGGIDVLSYGRLVGALTPAPVTVPAPRHAADDLTAVASGAATRGNLVFLGVGYRTP